MAYENKDALALQLSPDGSAFDAVAITPADTDLPFAIRGFYVGVAGHVAVKCLGGATVILKNVSAGCIVPVRCLQVRATGTTATDIVGLY